MGYNKLLANEAKNAIKSTAANFEKYSAKHTKFYENLRSKVKGSKGELLKAKHIDQMEEAHKAGDFQRMQRVFEERKFHEGQFTKARKQREYQKSLKKPFRELVDGVDVEASGELYVGLPSRF